MKRFVMILSLLFLVGCSAKGDRFQMVETPEINRSPLQGRWVVTSVQYAQESSKGLFSAIGNDAIFAPKAAIFDTQKVKSPRYTIRKGKTDYLMKVGYNKTKEEIGILSDNLFVIQIFDKDQLLFTVYREKEDVAYIDIYGNLLQLVKTKRSLDEDQLDSLMDQLSSEQVYYSKLPGQ